MEIKITSSHKAQGNVNVSNFFVSIAEFYINVNANTISLRPNLFTKDENEVEYPLALLPSDVLAPCVIQDLKVSDYAQKTNSISASGTEYEVQAQLLFALIFEKIAAVNALYPDRITYELVGF
jgi:hypothetical protein